MPSVSYLIKIFFLKLLISMAYCFIWWKKYFNNKNKDRVRGFLLQLKICSALQINTDYVIQKKKSGITIVLKIRTFSTVVCVMSKEHTSRRKHLGSATIN